ncbi:DUF262 domain-containing protein [Myxococcus vastator]|uniref:DUF262 domain-containing protein n=1 Tax=Myxococcus vastator TaxID=2709664 RepID=UPI0013D3F46E|nr:DUF262 domain-containing protein [Myxococcus vastator]
MSSTNRTADGLSTSALETKTHSVAKLLEFIRAGKVRIPYFQRRFRWHDEDRRLLFDSLQKGFPVGTLLLAQGAAPAERVVLGGFTADVGEVNDALWVVDGQQRLSTLAMALIDEHSGAYRPIYFDLEANAFVLGARRRAPPPHWVPTHVLASSALLNKWLRERALPDEFSDRADQIAGQLREYLLPAYIVPFNDKTEDVVKVMFARMNRNSRALRTDEVFEALHATREEGKPIERVRAELTQMGFGELEGKQIERAALAVAGKPSSAKLVDVLSAAEVPAVFSRVSQALVRTVEFLARDCGVPHVDWLPYGNVVSTLAKLFDAHPKLHDRNRALMVRWFWRGNLSGDHRLDYKTDQPKWQAIDDDQHGTIQRLLKLGNRADVDEALAAPLQPFNRRTARTKIELVALAALEPRWLTGEDRGEPLELGTLIEKQDHFPGAVVQGKGTIADYLLHPKFDVGELSAGQNAATLESHCLDDAMLAALIAGHSEAFEACRARALTRYVQTTLRAWAGVDDADHDRPPLDAYFDEESA